jgi:hypothetical protein
MIEFNILNLENNAKVNSFYDSDEFVHQIKIDDVPVCIACFFFVK